jgi:hypothetical protein
LRSYQRLGREQEAIGAYLAWFSLSKDKQAMVSALRDAARRGGRKGSCGPASSYSFRNPSHWHNVVASTYMALGDRENALAWLEKLDEQRGASMRALKVSEEWDPLRGDPRFQDLQRRANVVNVALVPSSQLPAKDPGRAAAATSSR